jgi:hypothetical protein
VAAYVCVAHLHIVRRYADETKSRIVLCGVCVCCASNTLLLVIRARFAMCVYMCRSVSFGIYVASIVCLCYMSISVPSLSLELSY